MERKGKKVIWAICAGAILWMNFLNCEAWGQEKKVVKIGVSGAGTFIYLPHYVAEGMGYYKTIEKEMAIRVEMIDFKGGGAGIALISGDVDIITSAYMDVIKAQMESKDIIGITSYYECGAVALAVRSDLTEVKTPRDLIGRKWGVWSLGVGGHLLGMGIAEAYDISRENVQWVPVAGAGGARGYFVALNAKKVDCVVASEPVLSALILKEGAGRILVDLYDRYVTRSTFRGGFITGHLQTTRKFANEKPQIVQAIVTANVKAIKFLKANKNQPEKIIEILPKEFLVQKESLPQILPRCIGGLSDDGLIKMDDVKGVFATMDKAGQIDKGKHINLSKTYDNSFAINANK